MRRAFPDGQPPSIRDFFAFEEHVRNARGNRGLEVPEAWYEIPVFYFSNPAAIYRDGDAVPKPADTAMLDYELELAAVIGTEGGIEGFTIMNDWSARDLQRKEMSVGLGPAKGKDFATSLGPELVSPNDQKMSPSDALLYRRPFTQACMCRSYARSLRNGSSSSGVTRYGPSEVAKSLPFTGPMLSFISRRWTSRALQSFMTVNPAMCRSASPGDRSAPPCPTTAATSSSKSSCPEPGGTATSSSGPITAAGFEK